jgi:hypothetical protein
MATDRCVYYVDVDAARQAFVDGPCLGPGMETYRVDDRLLPFISPLAQMRLDWGVALDGIDKEERDRILTLAYDTLTEYAEYVKYKERDVHFFISTVMKSLVDTTTSAPPPGGSSTLVEGTGPSKSGMEPLLDMWADQKIELPLNPPPPTRRRVASQESFTPNVGQVTVGTFSKMDEAFLKEHLMASMDEKTGTWKGWMDVLQNPNIKNATLTYEDLRNNYFKQEIENAIHTNGSTADLREQFRSATDQDTFLLGWIGKNKVLTWESPQVTRVVAAALLPEVHPVPDTYDKLRHMCFQEHFWKGHNEKVFLNLCAQGMIVAGSHPKADVAKLLQVEPEVFGVLYNPLEDVISRRRALDEEYFNAVGVFFDLNNTDVDVVDFLLRQYRKNVPKDVWNAWKPLVFLHDEHGIGEYPDYLSFCTAYVNQIQSTYADYKAMWDSMQFTPEVKRWLATHVDSELENTCAGPGSSGMRAVDIAKVVVLGRNEKLSTESDGVLQILMRDEVRETRNVGPGVLNIGSSSVNPDPEGDRVIPTSKLPPGSDQVI